MIRKSACALLLTTLLQAQDRAARDGELGAPILLRAGDAPIDVTVGHAAPRFFDFDVDGLKDLLVGEYGTGAFPRDRLPPEIAKGTLDFEIGKLRIYRNVGTAGAPRFADFHYLRAGDEDASIPTT